MPGAPPFIPNYHPSRKETMNRITIRLALFGIAVALFTPLAVAGGQSLLGYGRCTKCNCRHFEGIKNTCANSGCGHSYYDHL